MRPWLLLPARWAHDLMPWALSGLSPFLKDNTPLFRKFQWRGLEFSNPLGIAGGVDKTAQNLCHWQKLGSGFLEVGTITPAPQLPNSGSVLDRHTKSETLWNKMGFPNSGANQTLLEIQKQKSLLRVPLFVNIGKNRATANEDAHSDYIQCMNVFKDVADAFVINISSPNTQGLRQLLIPDQFQKFLTPITHYKKQNQIKQPILLKLSPDMTEQELLGVLDISLSMSIDGWVLTNTTTDRQLTPFFPLEGGVSGRPLASKSKMLLQLCSTYLKGKRTDQLLVSVGGVSSAQDILERLDLGADLVQVYSALVFQGPLFFRNCLREMQLSHGPA